MKKLKKILILGSSGQIGSALSEFLKKNYQILYFDIVNSNKQDLRISNNKSFKKLIKKCDFVFFLAFDVGGSRYLQKYQDTFCFLDNNIKIINNVFENISKYKKKFIFASSQMSNMNFSNYGILKAIGEKYTEVLGGIIIKFWNVYGIEKDLKKSHVITDFILQAKKNKKINMLTNGKERRDFLYVDDCCRGLELIMKNYKKIKKKTQYIDLATSKYKKILSIAKIIKKKFLEKKIKIKIFKSNKSDIMQKGKLNIANKFIFKYWKPQFNLNDGINKIIEYYKI